MNGVATLPESGFDVRFSLWRHGDAAVRAMPNTHLGDRVLGGDVADEAHQIHQSGARFVSVEPVVDLGGRPGTEHMIPVLSFIRELTSYGLEVDWRAQLEPGGPEWWVFSHLFPPAVLEGPRGDEVLAAWRARYHMRRCFLRRGPGFVQIRDRRHAGLRRLTISDGPHRLPADVHERLRGRGDRGRRQRHRVVQGRRARLRGGVRRGPRR
ncbi:DUF5825 family protein [Streptomyces sp. URMC 128]|uniref:DUF5825 family protein n=1 Tax=Streptomyces sp. URMC 128 TaxID=3423404 RepID=UPI003F1BDE21